MYAKFSVLMEANVRLMLTFFKSDFTGTHEASKDAIATFTDEGVTNAHIHRLRTN